eukprot:TRINITY_DN75102_c0_g1_i1.p1 TRINITY_DN75102_c0_g1~~TRINITY_DN75102_c0_g1_i1.p1  ORF type:complete len:275 (+),score=30.89 TRINITY_DN75102_c0_g1_i1:48-827(+)
MAVQSRTSDNDSIYVNGLGQSCQLSYWSYAKRLLSFGVLCYLGDQILFETDRSGTLLGTIAMKCRKIDFVCAGRLSLIAAFYFNYRAQDNSQEFVDETVQDCKVANLMRTASLAAICLSVDQLLYSHHEGGTWLNMLELKCRKIDLIFGGTLCLLVLYLCVSYIHDGSKHSAEARCNFSQCLQQDRCEDHSFKQREGLGKGRPYQGGEMSEDCKLAGPHVSSFAKAPGTDTSHKAAKHLSFRHGARGSGEGPLGHSDYG